MRIGRGCWRGRGYSPLYEELMNKSDYWVGEGAPNGGDEAGSEGVVGEAQQETALTNTYANLREAG